MEDSLCWDEFLADMLLVTVIRKKISKGYKTIVPIMKLIMEQL